MTRRGDVLLASFDPAIGSEAAKIRPAVVVSNDAANRASPIITVVPMTSRMLPLLDFQVPLTASETGLPRDSRVQCEQIRAISKDRIVHHVGRLRAEKLAEVDEALRVHLDL
jgi:mRNA interferase MazF